MTPRKILILGATGGTGRHLLVQALDAGHQVTALVRSPEKVTHQHERLRVVAGSVTDGSPALSDAVRGQDAVISALGCGLSLKSGGLIQQCVPLILAALRTHGVRRLIFTSAIGAGDTIRYAPLLSRLMIRVLLRDIYADKIAGEAYIRNSDLDWTLAQPAHLTTGPLTRSYRAGEALRLRGMPKISRADTAHFLLAQLDDPTYVRKVPLLAY
jgi:putative NADH-flavin reductase